MVCGIPRKFAVSPYPVAKERKSPHAVLPFAPSLTGACSPSAGVLDAVVSYAWLAYLLSLWLRRRWEWLLVVVVAALVLGISFNRLYLGYHYLGDILASYAAAAGSLATAWLVIQICWRLGTEVANRRGRVRG
jgi:membrane-associated phospholipid phosphatase